MSDIKVNRINRVFRIKVHLYFNSTSYNRKSDSTPRLFLTPVELLNVEKLAFTLEGGQDKGYKKYGNRFWKWKHDETLTDAQVESIYNEIKQTYPYGFVVGDDASTNKYKTDVKNNEAFQSFYKSYWNDNSDKIKYPEYTHEGLLEYEYPYIEFIVNEPISYKYSVGDVPETLDDLWGENPNQYYYDPSTFEPTCAKSGINITLNSIISPNYFVIEYATRNKIDLSTSGRYRFDLNDGVPGGAGHWPTGAGGADDYSGYRFRFSTGVNGSHNGHSDFTSGVSYVVSPERGAFNVWVTGKTAYTGPGDDTHPYMYLGHTSGYALSGMIGSSTGINVSGFGYDEGATLTLRRESMYEFLTANASNSGYFLQINTHASGEGYQVYSGGISDHNNSILRWIVPHNAPDRLYYTSSGDGHAYMGGPINIIDAPDAPKTGSVPGESIILDNDYDEKITLYYYSPDISGAGNVVNLITDCASDPTEGDPGSFY